MGGDMQDAGGLRLQQHVFKRLAAGEQGFRISPCIEMNFFHFRTGMRQSFEIPGKDGSAFCEVVFLIQVTDVDETTGLAVTEAGQVRVYPNPFSHSTTVVFPNPNGTNYRMYLMNISGKVVRTQTEITTSRFYIERGDLENGIYFLELRGEKTYRGKVVVE